MLTPRQIKDRLKLMNLKAVSRNSGIDYRHIYTFLMSDDPKFSIVKKLSDYLERQQKNISSVTDGDDEQFETIIGINRDNK